MVRVSTSVAAKIGKGLATPAAPSTTTHGVAKDFFREARFHAQICVYSALLYDSWPLINSLVAVQVCRILPWTVNNYKLDELVTVPELRRNIAQQFQKHSHVTSPQVSRLVCLSGW